MNAIAIEHKPTTRTNYTGCDDGAVPVKVYRKAQFVVAYIGEPESTNFFGSQSKFRETRFVEVGTGHLFTNSLYDGHYDRLADILTDGNIIEVEYEVGSNWIRSVNGRRWN